MKNLLLFVLCFIAAINVNAQKNNIVFNAVPINYKTYCNTKFQYCLKYPESFTTQELSTTAEEQLFEAVDGTTLEISAKENEENQSVKKAYAAEMKKFETVAKDVPEVKYEVLDKDWYIIITKDEIEVVAKMVVLRNNLWKTLLITMPKNRETYYKDKVDEIFKTFNPDSATGLAKSENSIKTKKD